jgi:hypothetical protein
MRASWPVLFAGYNQNDSLKDDKMKKACKKHGEKRNVHTILVRKPEGKRLLGILICVTIILNGPLMNRMGWCELD